MLATHRSGARNSQKCWAHLLRNITADAAHPEAAGNGHWNDPDFLAGRLSTSFMDRFIPEKARPSDKTLAESA